MPMYIRKSVLLLIAFLCCLSLNAQRALRGKVVDAKTMEPLPFASVFINFTTIGTNANENGEFVLNNIPAGDADLICSYVGHENYTFKLAKLGNSDYLEIKLRPVELKEVEVSTKKDEQWNNQLRRFESLFLGSNKNAGARIVNPWVLDFREANGIFMATASSPLEIENLGLGYHITYVLKSFAMGADSYNILGDIRFQQIPTEDKTLVLRWNENRSKAYRGSSRHLFRSIIDGTFEHDGFKMYADQTAPGPLIRSQNFKTDFDSKLKAYDVGNKVLKRQEGVYRILVPERLEVHYGRQTATEFVYQDISHPVSWIEVVGGFIEVNARGVVSDASRMMLSGAMGKLRIAEMLPYDFEPKPQPKSSAPEKKTPVADLIEKPYLQTDKPYYYPEETIWFKGYMNYSNRQMADTLSGVLYVEIIAKDKVVEQKLFQIENGMVIGQFRLPAQIQAGEYYLRAYTNWMRNFGDDYIFVKPLPVLNPTQSVIGDGGDPVPVINGITILPGKEQYTSNDRIQLKIAVSDSAGNPMYSNLSVSVIDVQQVSPVDHEQNILRSFGINGPARHAPTLEFGIEHGLCFKGEYLNHKGKPGRGTISLVEGNFENAFTIETRDNGQFNIDNIHFNDSTKIAVQGKTGKKTGTVKIYRLPPPPLSQSLESLKLDLTSAAGAQRYRERNVEDTTAHHLLPEIVVRSTPYQESVKRFSSKHGVPDVTIDGEWLRKINSTNLLYALQSRVAGFRVVAYTDGFGAIRYAIKLGGPSNMMGAATTAPLIVINDVPLALTMDEATQYLSSMNVNDIARVDVLKYGKGAAYGTRGGNGVIAIYLRTSMDSDETLANRPRTFDTKMFQNYTLTGYTPAEEFKSPEYAASSSEEPDYRSTIYWNPMLTTDNGGVAQVSFYAADLPTSYRVVVEGVTFTGQPVRGETILKIE